MSEDEKKNAGGAGSEPKGDDAAAGEKTKSEEAHVNPAPEDANTTPGSTGEK